MQLNRNTYAAGIDTLVSRRILFVCVALAMTLRMAYADSPTENSNKEVLKGETEHVVDNWKVSDKLFAAAKGAKEWLLQKDSGGHWSITQQASKREETVESVLVDWDRRTVYLNVAPSTTPLGVKSGWSPDECSFGLLGNMKDERTGQERSNDRKKVGLTVCNSAFTASSTKGVVGGVIGVLSLAYGSRVTQMAVKTDELSAAIKESGLLAAVEAEQLTNYRRSFSNARTSGDWNKFIRTYSRYDPDQLLTQAAENRDRAKFEEDAQREERNQRREAEETQRKEAQAKADEEKRQYEEQQRRQRMAQVEAFRRSIRIETETNCGPVLEIKGALVKIYFPVANYGNEHWVRKELLFPPQWECRFFNGGYQPPSL